MTVLLATDSSGVFPPEAGEYLPCKPVNGWTDNLIKHNPQWEYVVCRSFCEQRIGFTLYSLPCHLLSIPDRGIDVAILKTGYIERISLQPQRQFKTLFGGFYRGCSLRYPQTKNGKTLYSYKDLKTESYVFDLLKKKCKRVVFVGMHSLRRFRPEDEFDYESSVVEMREDFSKMATEYFKIPDDENWVDEYIGSDRMHLNARGIKQMELQITNIIGATMPALE